MVYKINTPQVAHETIDGETIIIEFESGTYYSVRQTAHDVWHLVIAGWEIPQIIVSIQDRYTGDAHRIHTAVENFIQQLAVQKLIVPSEDSTHPAPPAKINLPSQSAQPFTVPVLEQYNDMQDLLLLDPIHEVDEQGWPLVKPPTDTPQSGSDPAALRPNNH